MQPGLFTEHRNTFFPEHRGNWKPGPVPLPAVPSPGCSRSIWGCSFSGIPECPSQTLLRQLLTDSSAHTIPRSPARIVSLNSLWFINEDFFQQHWIKAFIQMPALGKTAEKLIEVIDWQHIDIINYGEWIVQNPCVESLQKDTDASSSTKLECLQFSLFIYLFLLWKAGILGTPLELMHPVMKGRSFPLGFHTQAQPTSIITPGVCLLTSC